MMMMMIVVLVIVVMVAVVVMTIEATKRGHLMLLLSKKKEWPKVFSHFPFHVLFSTIRIFFIRKAINFERLKRNLHQPSSFLIELIFFSHTHSSSYNKVDNRNILFYRTNILNLNEHCFFF